VASLAPAYLPRRPTETILHQLVRQNLESFVAYARENYEGGLPSYVEKELRAYLACGDFSQGFTRAHCDKCGHDLLVAFACHGRSICPSCCGRRMANTAAHLVDRVLPDVPVRQYVLSLPYELRRLAAFKADVLTALGRIFVEGIFATYRTRAKREGIDDGQCGSVTFVQRFGSLNLNVHFHVVVLDGVFARDASGCVSFHPATAPTLSDLQAIVTRVKNGCAAWLRRHGYIDDRPVEDRSNEASTQTAIDACAAIAMGRGNVATLPREHEEEREGDHEQRLDKAGFVAERDGFNLHADVRVEAGDDLGRERLCRYGARPPLSLERLRRLPGGRVAYRLKYVGRGRGKHRVMTAMEFMARLSAIIAPPRYPLTRFAGVLAPRSKWRRDVVPEPRERNPQCAEAKGDGDEQRGESGQRDLRLDKSAARCVRSGASRVRDAARGPAPVAATIAGATPGRVTRAAPTPVPATIASPEPPAAISSAAQAGDVMVLSPNIVSVRHWDRVMGGLLYAVTPRVDWATLLRRSFAVDVLQCPKCHGRLRVLAVITERAPVRRILAHLGMATEPPHVAPARDPTDDVPEYDESSQLTLGVP
jgi:Putative transposase/Transposase zinc-binding domain